MNESEILQVLKDFVEGHTSPASWMVWWDTHEADVKRVVSPGQFARLKPRIRSQGDVVVAERCCQEACAILRARGMVFAEGHQEQFAQGRDEFKARMEFGGKVLSIVEERYSASVPGYVSDQWFQEFTTSGNNDADSWIRNRTESLFQSVAARPIWINDPEWPWNGARPLVFITQYTVPESAVATNAGVSGLTVYIFSDRVIEGTSFRVNFQIIKQQLL